MTHIHRVRIEEARGRLVTDWHAKTFDKWVDLIQDDGPNFEDVALESLRLATWMMDAALRFPEWGQGFVQLASTNGIAAVQSDCSIEVITRWFPVEHTTEPPSEAWRATESVTEGEKR